MVRSPQGNLIRLVLFFKVRKIGKAHWFMLEAGNGIVRELAVPGTGCYFEEENGIVGPGSFLYFMSSDSQSCF
jgi:hypothetical protein